MRKRTIINVADQLFWLIIALLPLIGYGLFMLGVCGSGQSNLDSLSRDSYLSFERYMRENYTFGINYSSPVMSVLLDLFSGENAILPFSIETSYEGEIVTNRTIFVCLAWFIDTQIIHLAVDFILFIPRLCHKWMGKATQSET